MLKDELKNLLKQRLETSSLISLPNGLRAKNNLAKLMWILFSIASASLCALFIYRTITDYLSYEVVTKTDVKYETRLTFPIVTICNLNIFTTNYSREILSKKYDSYYPHIGVLDLSLVDTVKIIKSNDSYRYLIGKRLENFITECKFSKSACDLSRDFEYYYDYNYGNCFRFNSGKDMNGSETKLKTVSKNGIGTGLLLELYAGSPGENMNMFSKENGFIIFISDYAIDSSISDGISISPGVSTKIAIKLNKHTKKPKPYSNCLENLINNNSYDSECYRRSISSSDQYHYITCVSFCIQKYIGDNCKCQAPAIGKIYYSNFRICSEKINQTIPFEDIECMKKFINEFADSIDTLNECNCPMECNSNYFTQLISYSQFPTRQYSQYLIQSKFFNGSSNITFEYLRESMALVQIYFDELKTTVLTESIKMQAADLISSLGGLLGLFMGLSFLSFVEIFDFLINWFILLYNYNRDNKIRTQK